MGIGIMKKEIAADNNYINSMVKLGHKLSFTMLFVFLSIALQAQIANDTFIFVSDTQEPLFAETLIRKAKFNQTATKMIFEDILKKRPQNVFLLGDIVAAGSKPRRWRQVDKFLDSVRTNGGARWACLGNHE